MVEREMPIQFYVNGKMCHGTAKHMNFLSVISWAFPSHNIDQISDYAHVWFVNRDGNMTHIDHQSSDLRFEAYDEMRINVELDSAFKNER